MLLWNSVTNIATLKLLGSYSDYRQGASVFVLNVFVANSIVAMFNVLCHKGHFHLLPEFHC